MRRPLTFYGYFSGWYSYAAVCREIAKYLRGRRVDLQLCDITGGVTFEPAAPLRGIPRVPVKIQEGVNRAIVGMNSGWYPTQGDWATGEGTSLFFGWPEMARVIPRHEFRVSYVVADPAEVPAQWVRDIHDTADALLTPSKWSRAALVAGGVGMRIHVVRHGVDPAVFRPTDAEKTVKLRFFCTSPRGERKGIVPLLGALDALYKKGIFTGKGLMVHTPHSDVIRQFVERRGWGEYTEFTEKPVGSPTNMARALNKTEILLVPSRAEGYGLQALEALSCGVPVVATVATGMRTYLTRTTPGLTYVGTGFVRNLYQDSKQLERAPTVAVPTLATAIRTALEGVEQLTADARANAGSISSANAWTEVLERDGLLDELRCT